MITRLKEPFKYDEVEWKIQVVSKDKSSAMVVAYVDSRAIQKRLDDVAGAFNWRNEYQMWQDKSQLCGISIYYEERGEWVSKFDGADNSDFEPIKGGLSDAFKRTAVIWGIGRYLRELDGIWVDVEEKYGKPVIKENQYAKLEKKYNEAVEKIFKMKMSENIVKATENLINLIYSMAGDISKGYEAVGQNAPQEAVIKRMKDTLKVEKDVKDFSIAEAGMAIDYLAQVKLNIPKNTGSS